MNNRLTLKQITYHFFVYWATVTCGCITFLFTAILLGGFITWDWGVVSNAEWWLLVRISISAGLALGVIYTFIFDIVDI